MKVAFVAHSASLYGANRSLRDLLTGLAHFEIDPFVVVPEEGKFSAELREKGVPFSVIPQFRWFQPPERRIAGQAIRRFSRNGLFNGVESPAGCSDELVERLRVFKPDVVYTNSSVVREGAVAARLLELPHVWHLREFGDLDYGWMPLPGWDQVRASIAGSQATISVSRSVRQHFLNRHDPNKNFVIYNGIAPAQIFYTFLAERRSRGGVRAGNIFTFALVGRLLPSKGQSIAIQAVKRLILRGRRVRLIIAGDGESERLLQRQMHQLQLTGSLEFRGYVPDPFSVFLEADAALMCSNMEAFGRTTAEAMATGLPVIGHDAGGTSEIIRHEQNGLLYRGGSDALAASMERLMDNPAWTDKLGTTAWLSARARFSTEQYAKRVWQVIQHLGRKECLVGSPFTYGTTEPDAKHHEDLLGSIGNVPH